jgi:ubiquitin carboxyl-terminal hydrolase 4/11/15
MFIEPEVLGPDDKWYCPHCKEHMQAEKKMSVWRLPPILIIHLKRFKYYHGSSYGYMSDSRVKLDTNVKFPVQYVFKIKIIVKKILLLLIVILIWVHIVLQQQIHLNLVMIYLVL